MPRLPQLGARAGYFKQAILHRLIEHRQYICERGDDMPEITGWQWGSEARLAQAMNTHGNVVMAAAVAYAVARWLGRDA